eukprot:gene6608-7676_t
MTINFSLVESVGNNYTWTATSCPPPTGCDYLLPANWQGGLPPIPTENGDYVVIDMSAATTPQLITMNNIFGPQGYSVKLLVIAGDQLRVEATNLTIRVNGDFNITDSTFLVTGSDTSFNSLYTYAMGAAVLWFDDGDFRTQDYFLVDAQASVTLTGDIFGSISGPLDCYGTFSIPAAEASVTFYDETIFFRGLTSLSTDLGMLNATLQGDSVVASLRNLQLVRLSTEATITATKYYSARYSKTVLGEGAVINVTGTGVEEITLFSPISEQFSSIIYSNVASVTYVDALIEGSITANNVRKLMILGEGDVPKAQTFASVSVSGSVAMSISNTTITSLVLSGPANVLSLTVLSDSYIINASIVNTALEVTPDSTLRVGAFFFLNGTSQATISGTVNMDQGAVFSISGLGTTVESGGLFAPGEAFVVSTIAVNGGTLLARNTLFQLMVHIYSGTFIINNPSSFTTQRTLAGFSLSQDASLHIINPYVTMAQGAPIVSSGNVELAGSLIVEFPSGQVETAAYPLINAPSSSITGSFASLSVNVNTPVNNDSTDGDLSQQSTISYSLYTSRDTHSLVLEYGTVVPSPSSPDNKMATWKILLIVFSMLVFLIAMVIGGMYFLRYRQTKGYIQI